MEVKIFNMTGEGFTGGGFLSQGVEAGVIKGLAEDFWFLLLCRVQEEQRYE